MSPQETTPSLSEWRADPLVLARDADFTPDPWQAQLLTSTAQTLLVCCSRQSGKSTTVALLAVHALLHDNAMVLIVMPSERQSKEFLRKVLAFWRKLGRPIAHTAATRTSLELANGARLLALPASSDTIVGISAVTLLVMDEAARIPDELYGDLTPMLAVSKGRLVAPSTPKGKRGWWYRLWEPASGKDSPAVERIFAPAGACPRIAPEFLASERANGEWWYLQNYECQFLEAQGQIFRDSDIQAAAGTHGTWESWLLADTTTEPEIPKAATPEPDPWAWLDGPPRRERVV